MNKNPKEKQKQKRRETHETLLIDVTRTRTVLVFRGSTRTDVIIVRQLVDNERCFPLNSSCVCVKDDQHDVL
jgi:hypothetical protein